MTQSPINDPSARNKSLADFDSSLNKRQDPVAAFYDVDSPTLMVAFGGYMGGLGFPPFEFFNITSNFQTKLMYVRDIEKNHYFGGLPGITGSIDETAEYLKSEMENQRIQKSVFVGNCMGGYAAMLFGLLADADEIHVFGPPTIVSVGASIRYHDKRGLVPRIRTMFTPGKNHVYLDLKKLYSRRSLQSKCVIYYCRGSRVDHIYAERLRGMPNIDLKPYDIGGHFLVRHLKKTGELKTILLNALELPGG